MSSGLDKGNNANAPGGPVRFDLRSRDLQRDLILLLCIGEVLLVDGLWWLSLGPYPSAVSR